jgi:predicted ArsR family transcriptional regulator
VYAAIGGDVESPEAQEQRELVRIIQAHGGEITARQLMQASRRYRASVEEAEAALGRLVVAELATAWADDHSKGRGRPAVVYTLLDSGNGNTNGENTGETAIVLPLPPDEETEPQLPPETCPTNAPQDDEVMEWTG